MYVVLIVFSLVGLYISVYFTLVSYRRISPNSKFVPVFCRMEEGTCQLVVHHPDARVLGLPNSLLGAGFYLCLLLLGAGVDSPMLVVTMRFASWIAVVLGVYLVYSLVFKVRILCPLCLISHGLNLAIAFLLSFWW